MKIALILALMVLGAAPAAAPWRIHLIPCGPVPPGIIASLKDGLQQELAAEVIQSGEMPVPANAYSARRRQYLAETFIPLLAPPRPSQGDLALGITAVDLYVPGLNFVFGLADSRQRCAVISLARLNPESYGLPPDPKLFQERALKEAVHELGHLLGLGHCRNPACIMFFSNSLADTDRKGPGFCPECRRRLGR
jgi:archaemetzincin